MTRARKWRPSRTPSGPPDLHSVVGHHVLLLLKYHEYNWQWGEGEEAAD